MPLFSTVFFTVCSQSKTSFGAAQKPARKALSTLSCIAKDRVSQSRSCHHWCGQRLAWALATAPSALFSAFFGVAALEVSCSSNRLYLNSSSSKGLIFLWTSLFFIGTTRTCRIHKSVCRTLVCVQRKANNFGPVGFSVDNCRVMRFLSTGFSTISCGSTVGVLTKKPAAEPAAGFCSEGRPTGAACAPVGVCLRKRWLARVPRLGTCPCHPGSPCGPDGLGRAGGCGERACRPACAAIAHQKFFAVPAPASHRRF